MIQGNAAMAQKKTKFVPPPSARPRTRRSTVSHPTLGGMVEHVERVVDNIEYLRKRHPREFRAAERVRGAHERIQGQVGGVMDFDRARGGALPGSPPLPIYLQAAEDLSAAKRVLYPLDHRLVTLVACHGYPIDKAAEIILRRTPARNEKEEMGKRFRIGLGELAAHWWPPHGQNDKDELRTWHGENARPTEVNAGEVPRANAVHATGHKVFRNK